MIERFSHFSIVPGPRKKIKMGQYKRFWFALIGILIITFAILGYYGTEIYRKAPPIPLQVKTADGHLLFSKEQILDGQTAWQSVGGMQLGSIWGHGAYQAPDWSADWLHRELVSWLDISAQQQYGVDYEALDEVQQAGLKAQLKREYRNNRLDENEILVVSERRAQAMATTADYYNRL